jgi:hypothetical protein
MSTLAILGTNKTGTTSLWSALRSHPQISCSKHKEIVTKYEEPVHPTLKECEYFKNYFKKTPKTKIFLDGTPHLITNSRVIRHLKSFSSISRIVSLYTLRPPSEIAYSAAIFRGKLYFSKNISRHIRNPFFNDDNTIDYKTLEKFVLRQMFVVYHICRAVNNLGMKNIYFMSLKNLDSEIQKVFDFLEIEKENIEIKKLNVGKKMNTPLKFIKQKFMIDDWFQENQKMIIKFEDIQRKYLNERFGISSW